jgi:hypothetical protein
VIGKDIVRFHAVYWPALHYRAPRLPLRCRAERPNERPVFMLGVELPSPEPSGPLL